MEIKLKTGSLKIESDQSELLEKLTGFGSRPNKKRGFVFVSKVLGHRYPTRPSVMEGVYREIAALIKEQLDDQPTMVIGLVEAAAGLGCGVYHQLDLPNAFYMHTTYYRLDKPVWLTFQEEHSHAPTHFLYDIEKNRQLSDLRKRIKNIVVIDDEFSTGKTIVNFSMELRKKLPWVEKIIGAAILDWMPDELPDIRCVSLYKGDFSFDWKLGIQVENPRTAGTQTRTLDNIIPYNFGRLGIQTLDIPCQDYVDVDRFRNEKVLVLGTGECMYPAFLIGRFLEKAGVDVYVQTTSRAPYNIDADLNAKITFKDNYFEGIDNFLYNPGKYDSILICYETNSVPENHDLAKQLEGFAPKVFTLFIRSET
uniref:TRSP domain C terminus to PRTase_2 n=1 Tax=Candidatus Kentrum sp. MB TaxID=2138164 RepID=A0A450XPE3_9GAMM|nr:MAG: TRSP domain C terminus to PRTase_2 [Candidatus Kentron sp. MB]